MAVSKRLRFEVFKRDANTCRYCGTSARESKITIDHVVPVALGGRDEPSNLVTACADCNSGKASTRPNDAITAQVDQDAMRWAAAQKRAVAAMLEDQALRGHDRAEFAAQWTNWEDPTSRGLPLPDGWEASVGAILDAGLPLAILSDCLHLAMNARRVKAQDRFRYMCGIAWRRVNDLRDATAAFVSEANSDKPEPDELDEVGYELYRLRWNIEETCRYIPAERQTAMREFSQDSLTEYLGDDFTEIDVCLEMLRHLRMDFARQSFSNLPRHEQDEWLEKVRAGNPDAPKWGIEDVAVEAAKEVELGRDRSIESIDSHYWANF